MTDESVRPTQEQVEQARANSEEALRAPLQARLDEAERLAETWERGYTDMQQAAREFLAERDQLSEALREYFKADDALGNNPTSLSIIRRRYKAHEALRALAATSQGGEGE